LDIRTVLRDGLAAALEQARSEGVLQLADMPEITVVTPARPEQGDLASSVALSLAKEARRPPLQIAEAIVARLRLDPTLVASVEVAAPGFINFRLSGDWLRAVLREVLTAGETYGTTDRHAGQRVLIEYVSANPVGPIHIGNARGGPYGDIIGNLMAAQGWEVTREYYVNNGTNNTQFVTFGESLRARYLEALGEPVEWQPNWYRGDYVSAFGRAWAEREGTAYADKRAPEDAIFFADLAYPEVRHWLEDACAAFGLRFDVWTEERELIASGKVEAAIEELKSRGAAYEAEGALWLRTTIANGSITSVVTVPMTSPVRMLFSER
jgi:arginyl-tRNA synthetase